MSPSFQPMAAQLSKKAVLPLAKIIVTTPCRSSKTGPWKMSVTARSAFRNDNTVNMMTSTDTWRHSDSLLVKGRLKAVKSKAYIPTVLTMQSQWQLSHLSSVAWKLHAFLLYDLSTSCLVAAIVYHATNEWQGNHCLILSQSESSKNWQLWGPGQLPKPVCLC